MTRKTNGMPSIHDIVLYWVDKDKPYVDRYPVVIDYGEVCCFACNKFQGDIQQYRDRKTKGEACPGDIVRMWNSAKLERHHVLPVSLGGSDDCNNLVLLCPECHSEAPHISNIEYFWRWLDQRENQIRNSILADLRNVMTLFDRSNDDELLTEIISALSLHTVLPWVKSKEVNMNYGSTRSAILRDALAVVLRDIPVTIMAQDLHVLNEERMSLLLQTMRAEGKAEYGEAQQNAGCTDQVQPALKKETSR